MAMMNAIWDKLKQTFSNTSSTNIEEQNKIKQSLDAGKTIKVNAPKSERYTRLPNLAGKSLEKFRPETREEKDTLSPIGFYRQGEKEKQRADLLQERIRTAARMMNVPEIELSEDQKALVQAQTNNEREYSQDVPSTALKKFKYDPKTQELWVTFQGSNKKYWYPRVPKEKVEEMMSAPSKGEYFIKNIHDVYTVNPGHKSANNKRRNTKVASNYYGKMAKAYRKGMKAGTMKGVLNRGR